MGTENYTFIGNKIRLLPTKEQEELFFKSAGCSRFIYNWALNKQIENYKNDNKFIKTKNIVKLERKIKLVYRTLTNIRVNYTHQVTTEIVKTKPSKIVMETLKIKNMLKNKHLSNAISEQSFYRFTYFMEYKCKLYGIEFVKADMFYPSSKLCSCCGEIKKDLKLNDRIYKCCNCGLEIDRDYNASINLANYKN